ncbi:MAG: urease accessory protein UreD [Pseudomonadota bacterium]
MADPFVAAATASSPQVSSPLAPVRVTGGVSLTFGTRDGVSVLSRLRERDGHKARCPRGTPSPEAVLINTGGGLAGGDTVRHDVRAEAGAKATVTTQAAERIYRAPDAAPTSLDIALTLSPEAQLAWLPQEMILFNGARLRRRIAVDMPSSASLLLAETTVFGRTAHSEVMSRCMLDDQWRIIRDGRLCAAEAIRFDGDISSALSRPAIANGAKITGTMMFVAPDAEDRLEHVRRAIADPLSTIAASAWDGRLVIRVLAADTEPLRRVMANVAALLTGQDVPRVWWT